MLASIATLVTASPFSTMSVIGAVRRACALSAASKIGREPTAVDRDDLLTGCEARAKGVRRADDVADRAVGVEREADRVERVHARAVLGPSVACRLER